MTLPIFLKPRFYAAFLSLCMAASAVLAQDCQTPGSGDLYVDKDASGASDSNNGIYRADGGTGPFATIQKLVDTISPGQCGWVKPAATPYTETAKVSGQNIAGITFRRGGTSDSSRIIISGYPGTQPVIDQQRIKAGDSWGTAGFLIAFGSYITIRNFEIINTTQSSVHVEDSAGSTYIIVENNHLHHSYASENAGGVRLDSCDYCVVRNNRIHHHYRTFTGYTSNPFDSVPYGLNSGVHGFQPGGCTIENNVIANVDKGVQLKQSDDDGLDAHKVSGNIFVNIAASAYHLQLQGSGGTPPHNARFFNNIVYNAAHAVGTDLDDARAQAISLKIYNNTLVKIASLGGTNNFKGIEVYNNLISGAVSGLPGSGPSRVFVTTKPGSYINEIVYFDNNLYHNFPSVWGLGRDTSNDVSYYSLSEWRAARHGDLVYPNPDGHSLVVDPRFVNAAGGATKLLLGSAADYALSAGSPALNAGLGGVTIGAVRDGVRVGLLDDGAMAAVAPPLPPGNVSIEVN